MQPAISASRSPNTHTHTRTFPHTHAVAHSGIYIKCTGMSLFIYQTFTQDWESLVYRGELGLRVRDWTGSDASQWTLDLHPHLCPLLSQSGLSPDVCSHLNGGYSTTAAAYPHWVKGITFSTGLSSKHKRVAWAIQCVENKQITLSSKAAIFSVFFFPEMNSKNVLRHIVKTQSDVKGDCQKRKQSFPLT